MWYQCCRKTCPRNTPEHREGHERAEALAWQHVEEVLARGEDAEGVDARFGLGAEARAAARCKTVLDEDWIARTRALAAGADCMAGAFFAGYQAAVARIFPEFDRPGVSCFAATTRPEALRCTLTRTEDGLRLDGDKTWVACIDHLDRLVGKRDFTC